MCSFGFVAADDADAIALAGYAGGAVGGMVPVHMEVTEGHGCKTQKGYSYMEAVEPKWLMRLIQHDVCCINMNTIGNNVAIRFKNHDGSSMDPESTDSKQCQIRDGKAQHQSDHDHSHQCGHCDAFP